jgi:peptidylprolyl isomerase
VQKFPVVLVVLGATLALSGCGATTAAPKASEKATASATAECTPEGTKSSAVSVSGDFGAAPTVSFDGPLITTETERTVVIPGTGTDVATTGSQVEVAYTAYHGASGDEIDTTGYGADGALGTLAVDDSMYITGLARAINCSVAGDRVVAVIPPSDGFGDAGSADFGLGATDSMVFVIDVTTVIPSKATGVAQPAQAGLPTVDLAEDGTPTLTMPKTEAPDELTISVLKKGDGPVVASGDTVTLEYTGALWATGKAFDSSWTTAGPTSFATTDVVPGFGAALVGQSVGSQVLAVLPPAEGYGTGGNKAAGISGTDTLVFVVDILGTATQTPAH